MVVHKGGPVSCTFTGFIGAVDWDALEHCRGSWSILSCLTQLRGNATVAASCILPWLSSSRRYRGRRRGRRCRPSDGAGHHEGSRVALRIARLGPGRADARAALELADGLAESPGESWARVMFVSLGLPKVEPQVEIRDAAGMLVARVDFLFRRSRTVVEFDGLAKYGGAGGRQTLIDEKRREDALRSLGYQVVRLTWRDVHNPVRIDSFIKAAFSRSTTHR